MAYASTILNQLLEIIPRNEFKRFVGQHDTSIGNNIISDQRVLVGEYYGMHTYPNVLRCVTALDPVSSQSYQYLTNNFNLSASQIIEIYKARWHIELFFKWIKQNLKIKSFLGTSQNAVLSQIWIAMIYYLILAYIKFQTKFSKSLLELTRMINETLLVRRSLIDLLSLSLCSISKFNNLPPPQLSLF